MPDRSLLTHDAFEEALDRYGHHLEDWPAHLRPRAESLLATSDRAQRMMAEAKFIADALSEPVQVRANPDLIGRILQEAGVGQGDVRREFAASAEIIRPDWTSRRQEPTALPVEAIHAIDDEAPAVAAGSGQRTASRMFGSFGKRRYLAAAAIVLIGMLLGWSSAPLTVQEGVAAGMTPAGLAAYLSL